MSDTEYELHFIRSDRFTHVVQIVAPDLEDALRYARLVVRDQAIEVRQAGELIARVGRNCIDACRDMFGASAAAFQPL